jgi:hypothetical protein
LPFPDASSPAPKTRFRRLRMGFLQLKNSRHKYDGCFSGQYGYMIKYGQGYF